LPCFSECFSSCLPRSFSLGAGAGGVGDGVETVTTTVTGVGTTTRGTFCSRFGFSGFSFDFSFLGFLPFVAVVTVGAATTGVAAVITRTGAVDTGGVGVVAAGVVVVGVVVAGVVAVAGGVAGVVGATGFWPAGGVGGTPSSLVSGLTSETGSEVSGDVVVAAGAVARGTCAGMTIGLDTMRRGILRPGSSSGGNFTARTTTGELEPAAVATPRPPTTRNWGAVGSCTATPTAATPAAVEASGSKVAARCRRSIAFDSSHAGRRHASLIRVIILPRKGA
jgi:hypothetical protein